MSGELWRKSALELAGLIARKEVSSREVVQAHLARIDEVNPWVNAVVRRWDDTALADADKADKAVAEGRPLGVFHGDGEGEPRPRRHPHHSVGGVPR